MWTLDNAKLLAQWVSFARQSIIVKNVPIIELTILDVNLSFMRHP